VGVGPLVKSTPAALYGASGPLQAVRLMFGSLLTTITLGR